MKLRLPYPILLATLLVAIPAASYAQTQNAITEDKIQAIVDSIDRAARKGNVAAMVAPLAKDAKVKMIISVPGKKDAVMNLTKDQLAFHTRQGMRRRLAYTLDARNTRVKIFEDGQNAMVTRTLYESLTIQQGTFRSVASEVAIFSLRDGKIVVTSVESKIRFY